MTRRRHAYCDKCGQDISDKVDAIVSSDSDESLSVAMITFRLPLKGKESHYDLCSDCAKWLVGEIFGDENES